MRVRCTKGKGHGCQGEVVADERESAWPGTETPASSGGRQTEKPTASRSNHAAYDKSLFSWCFFLILVSFLPWPPGILDNQGQ